MTISPNLPWSPEELSPEDSGAHVLEREYRQTIEELAGDARAEARAAGRQFRAIHRMWQLQEQARLRERVIPARRRKRPASAVDLPEPVDQALRDVADEIGPVLHLPMGTALRRVQDALLLAEHLPAVLEALEAGEIGARQAEVILEAWHDLLPPGADPESGPPVEAVARVADELLRRAPVSTAAQLRALARDLRAALLRGTEEARHRAARRNRRVWVEPEEDGMARLCALLDAATAHAIHDRLVSVAGRVNSLSSSPESPGGGQGGGQDAEESRARTAGHIRADVLAELLLDGEPSELPEHLRGIRGHVSITVPALALLQGGTPTSGRELPGGPAVPGGPEGFQGCAELAGYGPIPISVAERIAATAPSWSRVLTHPLTGTVLDHDRATYAVPADLKRRLRARDGTCRFPGCRRRAEACDLDHTIAWADGGRTAAGNLAHLCRAHHVLKHRNGPLGRWQVRQRGQQHQDGVLEWTSPAGRVHVTYPQQYHHPVLSRARIHDPLPLDRIPSDRQPSDPQHEHTLPPRGLGLPEEPPPF